MTAKIYVVYCYEVSSIPQRLYHTWIDYDGVTIEVEAIQKAIDSTHPDRIIIMNVMQ